jgi:hypothetical protein
MESVVLGHVDVPSGILLVLDPGLGRFWRHDADPRSPRGNDPERVDLEIVGRDADAAAGAFVERYDLVASMTHPRYLLDVRTDDDSVPGSFAALTAERGFDARTEPVPGRVTHLRRARLAVESGDGAGVLTYNGFWAVAVGGVPTDRPLPVVATPMPEGEFAGRWRSIDVVADAAAEVATSETVEGVTVEHGQLMCVDLDALGEFRMWEPIDGLADFVFRGADAADLAATVGADALPDAEYGWVDVPIDEIGERAQRTQRLIADGQLRVGVDFRPHDNLERLNAQVRADPSRAGSLVLAGGRTCGFDNRWGDGIFTVVRDLDAAGRLVRVRLDVGNDATQRRMRWVRLMGSGAIVSSLVWDGVHPPRYTERNQANRPEDSGWDIFSGAESPEFMADHTNFRIVTVAEVIERFPAFKPTADAPVGSRFRLDDDRYVPD